jgi:hypothetical protein
MPDFFAMEFFWCRDSKGYRLAWDYPETRTGYCAIMRNGGTLEPLGPIDKKIGGLCFEFSRLRSAEDLLAFVQQNGMLLSGESIGPIVFSAIYRGDLVATGPGDSVSWCLESAKLFDELLRITAPAKLRAYYESQARPHFGDETVAKVETVPSRDGGITFKITSETLFGALWWHLVRLLKSGVDIKACRHCGCLFEAGPGMRRRDSEFCSEEHKITFHSLARSRPTRAAKSSRRGTRR